MKLTVLNNRVMECCFMIFSYYEYFYLIISKSLSIVAKIFQTVILWNPIGFVRVCVCVFQQMTIIIAILGLSSLQG